MLIYKVPGLFWFIYAGVGFVLTFVEMAQMHRDTDPVSVFAIVMSVLVGFILCAWMGYATFRKRLTALLILSVPSVLRLILIFESSKGRMNVLEFLELFFLSWTVLAAFVECFDWVRSGAKECA